MPRSRDPRSYSREYATVMLKAYRTGEHRFPPLPIKRAQSERSKFYSYQQAVRKNPTDDMELTQAVWQVSMRLDGEFDGTGMVELVMYHKENTPSAQLIRESLGMKSSFEEAKEMEERMAKTFGIKAEPPAADPMDKPFTYDEQGPGEQGQAAEEKFVQPTGNKYYTRKDRT